MCEWMNFKRAREPSVHTNHSFSGETESWVDQQSQGKPEKSGAIGSHPPAAVYFPAPGTPFLDPFCLLFHVLESSWQLEVQDHVGEGREKYAETM